MILTFIYTELLENMSNPHFSLCFLFVLIQLKERFRDEYDQQLISSYQCVVWFPFRFVSFACSIPNTYVLLLRGVFQ